MERGEEHQMSRHALTACNEAQSNNLFNRTRWDNAVKFNVHGPRQLKERWAAETFIATLMTLPSGGRGEQLRAA